MSADNRWATLAETRPRPHMRRLLVEFVLIGRECRHYIRQFFRSSMATSMSLFAPDRRPILRRYQIAHRRLSGFHTALPMANPYDCGPVDVIRMRTASQPTKHDRFLVKQRPLMTDSSPLKARYKRRNVSRHAIFLSFFVHGHQQRITRREREEGICSPGPTTRPRRAVA